MTLCDWSTGQLAAPVIVVTLRTRKIELTLATFEYRATRFDERLGLLIVCYGDWHATRLLPYKGGKRQHFPAFEWEQMMIIGRGGQKVATAPNTKSP